VLADQAADEAAIRANAEKYVESYNRRDSKAMASMWSPDAVYQDPSIGEGVVGREEIAKQLDYVFAGAEDAKLAVTVDSVEFLSPNVAIETGTANVEYSNHDPETFDYTAVHVKREGQWLLDRVSEVQRPAPPPSHYEQLKELEWMVGTWMDEDETSTIQTECEWTKNKNFLTRSFAVITGDEVGMSGMQIIGWDAAEKQIRSWVFDSDGTFAEGKWSRNEDTWTVQQVGTLPDGKKATATNIITKLDDDTHTWQSIDRQTDGEIQPNIEEVIIVRKPSDDELAIDVVDVIDIEVQAVEETPVDVPQEEAQEPTTESPEEPTEKTDATETPTAEPTEAAKTESAEAAKSETADDEKPKAAE
jgi:uncharacterized protein (TIGR02246 family)